MYQEKDCITVDHFKSEEIGTPYYFLEDLIDDSHEDTAILRTWMNHFKEKDHPFAVVYDNKTRLNRLVIEKAGK